MTLITADEERPEQTHSLQEEHGAGKSTAAQMQWNNFWKVTSSPASRSTWLPGQIQSY